MLLLLGVVIGMAMIVIGPWRAGIYLIGALFLVAALARLVVPIDHVGMLRVRGKVFDVVWTTFLGVSLIVLAAVVPPGP